MFELGIFKIRAISCSTDLNFVLRFLSSSCAGVVKVYESEQGVCSYLVLSEDVLLRGSPLGSVQPP